MINKKAFIFDTVAEALTYKIGADAKNTTYRTSFTSGATIHTGEPDIPYYSEILIRETSQVWRCNQWWGGTAGNTHCFLTESAFNALTAATAEEGVIYIKLEGYEESTPIVATWMLGDKLPIILSGGTNTDSTDWKLGDNLPMTLSGGSAVTSNWVLGDNLPMTLYGNSAVRTNWELGNNLPITLYQ